MSYPVQTATPRNSRQRLLGGLLAAALLSGLATPVLAQWVWKDVNGRVTASDRPPPKDVPDKDILTRPQPVAVRAALAASAPTAAVAAPVVAPTAADRELEARKRNADQAQEAAAQAAEQKLAQQRAENCRRARSHQAALESGQRIARTNEQGEREVLDDKGRAEELRRAREVITADCTR
jgi:type IV secretory pathway VirB10-like protein